MNLWRFVQSEKPRKMLKATLKQTVLFGDKCYEDNIIEKDKSTHIES